MLNPVLYCVCITLIVNSLSDRGFFSTIFGENNFFPFFSIQLCIGTVKLLDLFCFGLHSISIVNPQKPIFMRVNLGSKLWFGPLFFVRMCCVFGIANPNGRIKSIRYNSEGFASKILLTKSSESSWSH